MSVYYKNMLSKNIKKHMSVFYKNIKNTRPQELSKSKIGIRVKTMKLMILL